MNGKSTSNKYGKESHSDASRKLFLNIYKKNHLQVIQMFGHSQENSQLISLLIIQECKKESLIFVEVVLSFCMNNKSQLLSH